jgi:two-component system nitrate/nitrite response regulator NarL
MIHLPPAENVAVFSAHRYRAESIALFLNTGAALSAQAFVRLDPDMETLADFEIVLIDLDVGLEPVLDLIRSITTRHPKTKLVALGVLESKETVVKLAAAGASGYVPPETSSEELVRILQSVRNGEFTCPPHITHALFSHLADLADNESSLLPRSALLTLQERKVLQLLSQNLTNKEIATRLCISRYTAKNHVHRILKKLGVPNRSLVSRWLTPAY